MQLHCYAMEKKTWMFKIHDEDKQISKHHSLKISHDYNW